MINIIDWLLEDDTPEFKYRTMIELQGRGKDELELKNAYDHLLESDLLGLVLDKFQSKNKWRFNS